jgi:hypothetical protein
MFATRPRPSLLVFGFFCGFCIQMTVQGVSGLFRSPLNFPALVLFTFESIFHASAARAIFPSGFAVKESKQLRSPRKGEEGKSERLLPDRAMRRSHKNI